MLMAPATKVWTLEELDSLPDDGNTYELVRGELFVTPPPTDDHETIAARLHRILDRYAEEQKLGYVYRPRAVIRYAGSQVEPDLMVRQPSPGRKTEWEQAPAPSLVVEILSPFTRRRDHEQKREFYMNERRVPEYWIVDPESSTIRRIRPGEDDEVATELDWQPAGASRALTITLADVFGVEPN
jgi:Uma2 family endonuclease